MQSTLDIFKQELNIALEPRGRWHYPDGFYQSKQTINGNKDINGRYEGIAWSKFPKDNMAGFFLRDQHQLIIIDIDGAIIESNSDSSITLPELGMTLPETFHTITSNPQKQHYYYSVTREQQRELKGRNTQLPAKVDIFTGGSIFEGHPSDFHKVHKAKLAPLSSELYNKILSYQSSAVAYHNSDIVVSSHPQRYNLTQAFLTDTLETDKARNKFYSTILGAPKERTTKIVPTKHYTYDYPFINAIAVRLTTTSELSFDNTLEALNKIITLFGRDPNSSKTRDRLHAQILRALPKHESITRESILEDLDISHLKSLQPDTKYPFIVKIPFQRKVYYLDIDRYTMEPIKHGKDYEITEELARTLHPERNIVNNDGKIVGWDAHTLPLFYSITDPYKPQYQLDPETYQHTVNLFIPTQYQKDAKPVPDIDPNNIIHKLMASTIHPDYLDLMILWHAHVAWGHEQLNIIPWIATHGPILGGTGKTHVTGSILTKLIGPAIVKVKEAGFLKDWKDMGAGVRSVSLQDFGKFTEKEFAPYFTKMKQLTDPMFEKLDGKHSTVDTEKQTYQLSGTSNQRIPIPLSDRRIYALEPAHLNGETEPLNDEDAETLSMILRDTSGALYPELQEYMNYLMYRYQKKLTREEYVALFDFTPVTHYRKKWVQTSLSNGKRIVPALTNVQDFKDLLKLDDLDLAHKEMLPDLVEFMLHVYSPKTRKVGLPYTWFKLLLPMIMADQYKDLTMSTLDVGNILGYDIKINVGVLYTKKWKEALPLGLPRAWADWPDQGLNIVMSDGVISQYKEYLAELRSTDAYNAI